MKIKLIFMVESNFKSFCCSICNKFKTNNCRPIQPNQVQLQLSIFWFYFCFSICFHVMVSQKQSLNWYIDFVCVHNLKIWKRTMWRCFHNHLKSLAMKLDYLRPLSKDILFSWKIKIVIDIFYPHFIHFI